MDKEITKLRIAVYLDDNYHPSVGGGFSYYDALVEAIDDYDFSGELDVCFIMRQRGEKRTLSTRKPVFYIKYPNNIKYKGLKIFKKMFAWNAVGRFLNRPMDRKIISMEQHYFSEQLIKFGIHLVYYPKPDLVFHQYPFIMTNWDIGHRTLPPFPEVTMNGIYEGRENYYKNKLNKAFLILAESVQGKHELVHYYDINEDKIRVFPMFPGRVVSIKVSKEKADNYLENWGLFNQPFFFYPAQFWSHKNHYNLVIAFSNLIKKNPEVKLVFTGSDKGNETYIRGLCKKLGLSNSILFLGFVSLEELYTLYTNTQALVMPTFLGPTNMPLLEADALGTPVLCSDLPGHRELMGNRAVYFNPSNVISIEMAMADHLESRRIHHKAKNHPVHVELLDKYFSELIPFRFTFGFEFNQS